MTALVLFDDRPTNTADRLVRYGRVQAVQRAASQELDRLKDEFEEEADTIEAATGGAYNVKLPSGAQALKTQPKAKPYVRSDSELLAWLKDEGHDDLWDVTRSLKVTDETEACHALDQLGMGVAARIASVEDVEALLATMEVVEVEAPVDAVLDGLLSKGCVVGPSGLVSPDGEPVPGTEVRQGDRHVRVTIPSDVKAHHDSELRSMFQLTAGDEA